MSEPLNPQPEDVLAQLRAEKEAAGLKWNAVAKTMGRDYTTILSYVNGEREMPVRTLMSILDAIGIDFPTFAARVADRSRQH